MKKMISIILSAIVCLMSSSAFAAIDMEYQKVYNYGSVKLEPIDAPGAVLVIAQYKVGKLIDMDIINIVQPDDGYTMPSMEIKKDFDYKFFVYDNLNFENELFNCVEMNSQTPNRLFLGEYKGHKFERIE